MAPISPIIGRSADGSPIIADLLIGIIGRELADTPMSIDFNLYGADLADNRHRARR